MGIINLPPSGQRHDSSSTIYCHVLYVDPYSEEILLSGPLNAQTERTAHAALSLIPYQHGCYDKHSEGAFDTAWQGQGDSCSISKGILMRLCLTQENRSCVGSLRAGREWETWWMIISSILAKHGHNTVTRLTSSLS